MDKINNLSIDEVNDILSKLELTSKNEIEVSYNSKLIELERKYANVYSIYLRIKEEKKLLEIYGKRNKYYAKWGLERIELNENIEDEEKYIRELNDITQEIDDLHTEETEEVQLYVRTISELNRRKNQLAKIPVIENYLVYARDNKIYDDRYKNVTVDYIIKNGCSSLYYDVNRYYVLAELSKKKKIKCNEKQCSIEKWDYDPCTDFIGKCKCGHTTQRFDIYNKHNSSILGEKKLSEIGEMS